jgi:hypothetical protein
MFTFSQNWQALNEKTCSLQQKFSNNLKGGTSRQTVNRRKSQHLGELSGKRSGLLFSTVQAGYKNNRLLLTK